MYYKTLPQDSVLRRHFESAAAMQSAAWLQQPPSDSVLRRHFDQLQSLRSSQDTALPSDHSAPAPIPPALKAPPAQTDEGGGFLGWLRKLFG